MKYKLSICIPTYNRAAYIDELLASIVSQNTQNMEVVISDNASDDCTQDIVDGYSIDFPFIKYFRSETNIGPDRNFLRAVDYAVGDFCWIVGSDDFIKNGAIEKVLNAISDHNYPILLLNRDECDKNLNFLRKRSFFDSQNAGYEVSNDDELIKYFKHSSNLCAVFSYLSSVVFERNRWNNIRFDESFYGTGYPHVYKLLSMLKNGLTVGYFDESLVLSRGDNDTFMENGFYNRFMLDVNGYMKLSGTVFCDNEEVGRQMLRVISRDNGWLRLIKLRFHMPNCNSWKDESSKLVKCGFSPLLLGVAGIVGSCPLIVELLMFIKSFGSKIDAN